ncbi:MAG: efflux RND transporter periplasmic adaptor subunit [Verrucomicrobia bacterium]|nr:efflux RND transporter periplasmic adaptor subunit [Verrucomicrobiota bacterium]MCH8528281.1 HlyD family secretion protein [Kiritimatiellia bacterium]
MITALAASGLCHAFSPVLAGTQASVLEREEAHPSLTIRVQTFAREQVIIENPIRWPQFTFRLPEGSLVKKGDTVFEFDLTAPLNRQRSIERNLAETQNQIEVQLGRIQQRILGLEDQKSALESQREVLRARREYLKALPRPEDVAIAKSRLDVALRNREAVQNERDIARDRLERELVSPGTLERAETELALQQARTAFAENRLRSASLPATTRTLRINELRIENLNLEIEKLELEIESQREILRIETRTTDRRLNNLEREQAEVEEELRHGRLTAPSSGVLIYTPRLKRELASGGKPARGMALVEIPDPESLALQGRIPEEQRSLFRVGDSARVTLNPVPDREFIGRIHSISPLPRDISETDRRTQGDASAETGVMVFDTVIVLDELPEGIPFGVFGTAKIRTAAPIIGPSVPLEWVRMRDGNHHISVNGVFTPVNGVASGTRFILQDRDFPLRGLSADGDWLEEGDADLDAISGDRVTASGALIPLESIAVNAPSVRAWDLRITRLAPEDTYVQKGDILAELDSENITSRLRDAEDDLTRRISNRESAEENLALRRREAAFQIASARNQLEIRRLEVEQLDLSLSTSQLHQAQLEETTARIQLAAAERELQRAQANPDLTAPTELRRRQRDVQHRRISLEQAEIRLALAEETSTELERSQANLELARQESRLSELENRFRREIANAEAHFRRQQRIERSREERLANRQDDLKAMVIRAESDGLLKYENLFDGVTVSKIRTGMNVWSNSHLMSISDSDRMVVRVQVSERYIRFLKHNMPVQVRIPSEGSQLWTGSIRNLSEILVPATIPNLRAGVYANLEPPLEHVIDVEVILRNVSERPLKPGAIAHVIFPFRRDSQ